MTKTDNVIKLLLIEDSADEAEQIISMLRNGGIAVRPSRAGNEAELEDLLERQTPDLILANLGSKDLPLRPTAEALNRTGKDIGLVVYGSNVSDNDMVEAFRDGARALALQSRPDHLQMIVRREFEALTMRRSVRRLENALRESERRCSDLLDSSRDPIAYVHEGMHVRANRAYLETFGYEDFEDIESMSILDMVAADDADDFKTLLKRLSKGERPPQKLNLKAQRADGTTFAAVMEFAEAMYEGEPCQQIVFRQQESDPGTTEELEELRRKDLVTELFNRQHLTNELDQVVAAANAGKSDQALILMELDNARTVRDGIGLGNTDLLLGDMANLLRRHLKEQDIPGRLGEYTFGILVHDRNAEAVGQLVETLRKAFEERIFEIGKNSINLTMSVAASMIGEKAANGNAVLDQTSVTLRAVQTEGGNLARVFDPAAKDKADAEKNRHWLKLIKDALNNDGYVLYFQPIISLQGAEGDYYEILLRMKGPKGEILPAFFMPIAEQYDLMPQLDRWVISTAIRALSEREQGGRKTTFFIKLAPQSLDD
ncbi:MAG: EAL domain-containing protein, partial [Dokdonella sp.]